MSIMNGEKNNLNKRYGLPMAICMVIGIVIGSGVFFKAEKVLVATSGNLRFGIVAWIIGASIMVVCAYTFSLMAQKFSFVNGVIDYAQNIVGDKYAYMLAWFMTILYTPAITGVVAWVAARYVCVIFGYSIVGAECLAIAGFFLVYNYGLNALAPILTEKFQVTTTAIKLIPLLIMAIIGLFVGLSNGLIFENFSYTTSDAAGSNFGGLLTGVVATAFAYEGWILATTINQELKDSKKDLPKALVLGTICVAAIYILYYVGLSGVVKNEELMKSGEEGAKLAFQTLLGKSGGIILMVFVVISCLGTLNGLMVSCVRSPYSLASRNQGVAPKILASVDVHTNMPTNSSIVGLLLAEFWLFYFYGANLQGTWFAPFTFDSSEIPIVTLYAMYVPIFFMFMKQQRNHKEPNIFNRTIMPLLSILGSLFMVFACFIAHGKAVMYFLIVFIVVMAIGYYFGRKSKVFK